MIGPKTAADCSKKVSQNQRRFFCNPGRCILLSGNECHVLNDERDPCVFPFTYGGTLYNHCTDVDETFFWCATEVDESLEATKWGQCGEKCPKGRLWDQYKTSIKKKYGK